MAEPTDWAPEVHTGLPEGFTLFRREVPDYALAEYQIRFAAGTTAAISLESEYLSEYRDQALRDLLGSLAHFITIKAEEAKS